jgi:NADH-quinone oxidoreductase subunit D
VDHYGIYDRFDFRVPLGEHGDVYDRMMVRLLEVRESIKILEAALKDIPGGPVMDSKAKNRGLRPKPGEAYGRIEAPKGRTGLLSDQRRWAESLSLPCASAQPDQPDDS